MWTCAFTNQGLYTCYYNEDSVGPVPSQIKGVYTCHYNENAGPLPSQIKVCTHVIIMKTRGDHCLHKLRLVHILV